jgi:methionyl-tRNA formyltransferase
MSPVRVVFLGTAELACASLEALRRQAGVSIVGVVTQPDRPKGRDLRLQPSPVKQTAQRLGLSVLQPEKAREPGFVESIRLLRPDLMVVAAYGQILPQALLDVPRFGSLNVHTSLLPQYRGAAPIQWALLEGDAETGVTIMQVNAGLDTGPIVSQARTPILDTDDAVSLHDRLATLGGDLLCRTLSGYLNGSLAPQPQPEQGATYARKITKEDGWIDWSKPARRVWNQVRGLTPWPTAWTRVMHGQQLRMLKVWRAEIAAPAGHQGFPGTVLNHDSGVVVACGEGSVRLLELQREGGRRQETRSFLPGHPLPVGLVLQSGSS